jgi:hypothetical protein
VILPLETRLGLLCHDVFGLGLDDRLSDGLGIDGIPAIIT